MTKKLFVGGLSWDTNETTLSEFFQQVGTVETADVIKDRYTGKSKGFGFVEMATEEEAAKAKEELNEKELDGRTINVSDARPQEKREGGGGFDRGNKRRPY